MAQADSNNSISVDSSRRRFLAVAAAASAVSATALAAAAMPANQACAVSDDSGLLQLEEQIFEQHELADQYNDEIARLAEIWSRESNRRCNEALAEEARTGIFLTPQERWKLTTDIPECAEHQRLSDLQEPHYREMDRMIAQMWATPAHTPEGRQAKVWVLLRCILRGDGWRETDDRMEYEKQRARDLLIEFVGGEPATQLRNQFSAEPGAMLS